MIHIHDPKIIIIIIRNNTFTADRRGGITIVEAHIKFNYKNQTTFLLYSCSTALCTHHMHTPVLNV